jgi:hypothetical protein
MIDKFTNLNDVDHLIIFALSIEDGLHISVFLDLFVTN